MVPYAINSRIVFHCLEFTMSLMYLMCFHIRINVGKLKHWENHVKSFAA